MELSGSLIRLYNILSRCASCKKKKGRKPRRYQWPMYGQYIPRHRGKTTTLVPGNKCRAPKKQRKHADVPCFLRCPRITADDLEILAMYATWSPEILENFTFEPDPRAPDHFPGDITAFPDEQGCWTKIELTSLI